MKKYLSDKTPRYDDRYVAIIHLGVIQLVVATLIVCGCIAVNTGGLDGIVLAVSLLSGVAILVIVGAVIAVLELYVATVYLIDKKPSGRARHISVFFIFSSVVMLLLTVGAGVMIVSSQLSL